MKLSLDVNCKLSIQCPPPGPVKGNDYFDQQVRMINKGGDILLSTFGDAGIISTVF